MKKEQSIAYDRGAAVLYDPLHLLVHQLDAPQRRVLQSADLSLYEQLEGDLRHEERRSRSRRVADRSQNVDHRQTAEGLNGRERLREGLVEDVADARASAPANSNCTCVHVHMRTG